MARSRLSTGILVVLGVSGLGACERVSEPVCTSEPTQCATILTEGVAMRGEGAFREAFIRLRNDCMKPVDLKVCFEDQRLTADCRETTGLEPLAVRTEAKSVRFFADGIKLFVRYSDTARQCRFPLSDRVTFSRS